jgi:ribosomal protein L37E
MPVDRGTAFIGRLKKYKQNVCPRCGKSKLTFHARVTLPLGETTTAEPLRVVPISCRNCGEVWFVTDAAPTARD